MSIDASFQLGFELTNILNTATQAVSAISSIAMVDAVRKAGSDVLTEVKLASFLGRNRIDSILEVHFRQAVAKSERNLVSRYLEIVLESGAGPTVQNALKDTALFSMIVQMSLLCSVHEHQPFANAIMEAIERIVKDFKGNPRAIPDYPSLLGTMRVIQRETAAFQWSALFESVERTIQERLSEADPHPKPLAKRRKLNKTSSLNLDRHSIKDRGISFPILQSLLMALESLQHFCEERQIYIECGTGISTLVVWCFHVLGLSVKISIEDRDVKFGHGLFNVLIKETFTMRSSVSLIVPRSQDKPLFTLSSSEQDPKFGPELRAKILRFGQTALKEADVQPGDMIRACQKRLNSKPSNSELFKMEFPDVVESFKILAYYLLGQRYSDSFIEQALLVSDCGWSIFFDAIDATDPSDVSICNLRILAGVPTVEDASKDKVVKDKVLDGPTELSFSYSDSTVLKADWFSNTSSVNFFPGVSTAIRGDSLIGFRDDDVLLATQSFIWNFKDTDAKTHILGFREMLDLCRDSIWLPPCACNDKTTELGSLKAGQVFTIKGSSVDRILPTALKDHEVLNSEYAICVFPTT